MDIESFKHDLACGLGRCYIALQGCENKEPYRQAVLDCCLANPCYDTQSEGTRAKYLYAIIKLFGGDGFLQPVIDKFNGLDESYGWEFEHLCDLLFEFASDGNARAADALKATYGRLYSTLLTRREFDGYDACRDNFERVSINLVRLYGEEMFLKIAEDMGELFLKNDRYDGFDFEFFYVDGEDTIGADEVERLEKRGGNSPALKTFFKSVAEAVKPIEIPPQIHEKSNLVREYAATNEVYDVEKLIKELHENAIDKDDESDWHGIILDILDAAESGAYVPKSELEYIYNNSLCSCCRHNALTALNSRGWLSSEILRECEFDSNGDVRKFFQSVKSDL